MCLETKHENMGHGWWVLGRMGHLINKGACWHSSLNSRGRAVFGLMLERIILEVFSILNDSMILRGHLVSEDATGKWEEQVSILPLLHLLEVIL